MPPPAQVATLDGMTTAIPARPETTAPTGALTDLDSSTGEFTAVVAVTNVVDDVFDLIEVGAFGASLARRTPKGVMAHDWTRPIARAHEVVELRPGDRRLPARTPDGKPWPRQAGALLVRGKFLATRDGQEAAAVAREFGEQQAFSIGYRVPDGGAQHRGGVRHIKSVDLYEFSTVLVGANSLAGLQSVKAFVPDGVEIKSATAVTRAAHPRTAVDPINVNQCAFCLAPAAGSLGTRPTVMVALTCNNCTDRIHELIGGGGDDALPPFDELTNDGPAPFAATLTCSVCGGPAGGRLGRAAPRGELICPACVAAIRGMADGRAHAGDPDQPTTPADYRAALADQTQLTMTADARLVPDTTLDGAAWSPAHRGRSRY